MIHQGRQQELRGYVLPDPHPFTGYSIMTPLESLIACGTKLWLDSIDPDLVVRNRAWGATGATSNPIIIADLIKTGRFDDTMTQYIREGLDDEALAWRLTDMLVRQAQEVFLPAWQETQGDNGYVSFELDPLLEDPKLDLPPQERTKRYIALGKQWSAAHRNRMIKVPATRSRAGGAGRTGCGRRDVECDADLLRPPVRGGARRHLARRSGGRPGGLQIGVQHLRQPARRLHGKARAPAVAARRRAWSASSTPSASGR